uniref:Mitotic checkpoint serine/threonine-protein kinase BUB1 n=1 Tax=Phallusia mammillata TaxID=59560 RepID=A0A6F9D8L4_9ASCI|nr:mitotic checkpoint serine/threonine-protein kinase BUB1 [Phallusia mammillata]
MEYDEQADVMLEASKENVQPLRTGRNMNCLKAALKPSEEDLQVLRKEHQRFEEDILAGENSTDPIDAWDKYLKWTKQHLTTGENTKTYEQLLQKYINKFFRVERYKNDSRYVSAWLNMAQLQNETKSYFRAMLSEGIGTTYAPLYVIWAEENEKNGKFKSADQIYNLAEKNGAEPKEYLQKMRNAFQMRVARASSKQLEQMQNLDEPETMTQQRGNDQRKALGTLSGRGTRKAVGTTRTGHVVAGPTSVKQTTQLQQPKAQKNSKLLIYNDANEETDQITGGSGWAELPDKKRAAKENLINDPKMWKGEKVKQKPRSTALTVKVPPPVASTSFAIYQEETPENSATGENLCPPSARKVCPNVEKILTDRKINPFGESDFHKRIRESYGDKDSNVIRMYPVDKVYSVMGEFSPEEIMAAKWRKRKREREEKEKIERELEEKRRQEEQTRREKEMLEEKLLRREDQLKQLIQLVEEKDLMETDEPIADTNTEMTVKLNSVYSKVLQRKNLQLQNRPMPQQTKEEIELVHEEVAEEVEFMNDDVKVLPLPEAEEIAMRDYSQTSLSNSLNRSKLTQPSPTIFTKEAIGEINGMFQMPLTNTGASLLTDSVYGGDNEVSMMPLAEPVDKPAFEIFCDDETDEQQMPLKFNIFKDDDKSEDSENIPTPGYVSPPKRHNLSGILQPAVGFELADPDEDSQEEEDDNIVGVEPLITVEPAPTFLDDVTIAAGQNLPGETNLPLNQLQDIPSISSTNLTNSYQSNRSAMTTTNKFDDSIQLNFGNRNKISAESTTYWQGSTIHEVTKQDVIEKTANQPQEVTSEANCTEIGNQQQGVKKLSPILEASYEYEKSVQSRSRLTSSETDGQASVAITTTGKSFIHPPTINRKPLGELSAITYDPMKTSTAPTMYDMEPEFSSFIPHQGISKLQLHNDNDETTTSYSPMCLPVLNNTSIHPIELNPDAIMEDELCDQMSTSLQIAPPPDHSVFDVTTFLSETNNLTVSGRLTIVEDPWDEELLNRLLPPQFAKNLHVIHGKTPVARKGSTLNLGDTTYHLADMLGRGGFAKVYKATVEGNSNTIAAVKIQSPPHIWESYIVSEAKRRCNSDSFRSSLLQIHATSVFPEASFIVSEFLSGGTLLEFVRDCAVHSRVIDDIDITFKVMKIVNSLHEAGIIHGDIKPDNFMVVSERDPCKGRLGPLAPVLKLIDFGRAIDMKAFPAGTAFKKNCGTSGFVCSQMMDKLPWNYHTDFHGLAGTIHVVLYNCYMTIIKQNSGEWSITKSFPRGNRHLWSSFFKSLLNVSTPTDENPFVESPLPNLLQLFGEAAT